MRFFLDTANVADIRKANDLGVICGVTTNPSLIAKEVALYFSWLTQWLTKSLSLLIEQLGVIPQS